MHRYLTLVPLKPGTLPLETEQKMEQQEEDEARRRWKGSAPDLEISISELIRSCSNLSSVALRNADRRESMMIHRPDQLTTGRGGERLSLISTSSGIYVSKRLNVSTRADTASLASREPFSICTHTHTHNGRWNKMKKTTGISACRRKSYLLERWARSEKCERWSDESYSNELPTKC